MKKFKLTSVAAAASIAMGAAFAPQAVQADVSATVGVSSMYLWRGQNLTPDGGQVHGSLDYSNKSGMYAGIWTSSENGGNETDLYIGYGGSVGDFSYDVSYWKYLYPENGSNVDLGDNDTSDIAISGSYGPITATAYINVESDNDDDNYYTVSGSFDKFTVLYGWWDLENPGNEYSHIQVSYQVTDEVSASISMADNDVADTASGAVETDPLFQIGYTKSFDLK